MTFARIRATGNTSTKAFREETMAAPGFKIISLADDPHDYVTDQVNTIVDDTTRKLIHSS